ncbi:hypothetical protein SCHPADRAFT_895479 [Schizopora paradoxa]|uniref:Uncharacterized protein n=1 Tax=Schizopora paradoxa TaxID=27342 RepID=A0A0H2RNF8_9AGAM|nr:hypothetical protein SCHPADRAFT_895479 [Schizopora paradoxa]
MDVDLLLQLTLKGPRKPRKLIKSVVKRLLIPAHCTSSFKLFHPFRKPTIRKQGLALAYIAQMLFVTAIATASSQILWRNLRLRWHSISEIDALMKTRFNPFTFSAFPAAKAPIALSSSASRFKGVFRPITREFDVVVDGQQCFRSVSDFTTPIGTELSTGMFLPPLNLCDGNDGVQCSYELHLRLVQLQRLQLVAQSLSFCTKVFQWIKEVGARRNRELQGFYAERFVNCLPVNRHDHVATCVPPTMVPHPTPFEAPRQFHLIGTALAEAHFHKSPKPDVREVSSQKCVSTPSLRVIKPSPAFGITSCGFKFTPDGQRNRTVVISATPGNTVKSAMETLDLVGVNSAPPTAKQSYGDLIIRIQNPDLKLFSRKIDTSYSSPFFHKSVKTRSHVKTKVVAENVSLPRSVVRYGRLWTLEQQACQDPIGPLIMRIDVSRRKSEIAKICPTPFGQNLSGFREGSRPEPKFVRKSLPA